MDTIEVTRSWKELKGKFKHNFSHLTDEDLSFKKGKTEELLSRLQEKLGTSREELRQIIEKI